MNHASVGEAFERWALNEPTIDAVVMLGSRARVGAQFGSPDEGSDWDFYVIASRAQMFCNADWTARAALATPLAYASRSGRITSLTKVSIVFPDGEVDIVVLPGVRMQLARLLMRVGIAQRIASIRRALADLTLVLLPGYRILKGEDKWRGFFSAVLKDIAHPRLDNQIIRELAEAYVVDYVSTRRKIVRGEYLAAQRWLHIQLAETNFRFLHELRLRRGRPSFPDARRLEFLGDDRYKDMVRVSTRPTREELLLGLERSAETLRELVNQLVGDQWKWPGV